MEKFYLEMPTLERKIEALEYLQEHVNCNSKMNGTGGLKKCLNEITYEEWIEELKNCMNKESVETKNLVPATTYFTIRENDNKIIGMVNFRHYLNEELRNVGGHIGYGIRPSERRKGYAKIQLYLTLIEAKKLGLNEVMIDCIDTNIGSEKTIQALGGVFEKEYYDVNNNEVFHNYWINVDKSLDKYKDIYEQYIAKEKVK